MEKEKITSLGKKIENMKEGFEGCHTCDIKISFQNLKDELKEDYDKCGFNKLTNRFLKLRVDTIFKKHIGELE